ncbi:MAG: glycyl-radical enzyme activating protein [Erysipelotrichaceae bacterium]|nr:glycyl-radical enzyme activating protein [Erysipelotrichaceae bacterium]
MKSSLEQPMTTSKALVFDIKRFAVHDGTGIRTTVFFKGCPLRCKWCQNPEGLSPKQRPIYFENSCIHCHLCEQNAYPGQMTYQNDRPYFNLDYDSDFDNLIRYCPSNAIRYDSQPYTIDELMDKIKQDEVFFKQGGGVTFSGGEPFMQGQYLIELLKRCKQENIHTAIETTLYASLELIKQALPYLDLIYIDLKEFDETKHKNFTQVSSKIIKEHIQYILESKYKNKVIIRTPLIPSMTATDDNIQSIARFIYDIYPEVKYELLNYNPLASAKYSLVDLEYALPQYQKFSPRQMQHFYDIVQQTGLKNLIKE